MKMKLSALLSPIPSDEELAKWFPMPRKKGTPYVTNQDLLLLSLYLNGCTMKEIAERANLNTTAEYLRPRIKKIYRILRQQIEIDVDISRFQPKQVNRNPNVKLQTKSPRPVRSESEQLKLERDQLALYICKNIAVDAQDCKYLICSEFCPFSRSHNREDCIVCIVENLATI